MEDGVQRTLELQRNADVVPDDREAGLVAQVVEVSFSAGQEVVDDDHVVAAVKKSGRQMRTDKPCPASEQDPQRPTPL